MAIEAQKGTVITTTKIMLADGNWYEQAREIAAIVSVMPQDSGKYGIEVQSEDGEIWYSVGFEYHSKYEDNDE